MNVVRAPQHDRGAWFLLCSIEFDDGRAHETRRELHRPLPRDAARVGSAGPLALEHDDELLGASAGLACLTRADGGSRANRVIETVVRLVIARGANTSNALPSRVAERGACWRIRVQ